MTQVLRWCKGGKAVVVEPLGSYVFDGMQGSRNSMRLSFEALSQHGVREINYAFRLFSVLSDNMCFIQVYSLQILGFLADRPTYPAWHRMEHKCP